MDWARFFSRYIAHIPFVQSHYIKKYGLHYEVIDGWCDTYANENLISSTGFVNEATWKWKATIIGLSCNKIVSKLITLQYRG